MAGYSGTPLARKLGIKPGAEVFLSGEPEGYRLLLEPLPDGVRFVSRVTPRTDLLHIFSPWRADLEPRIRALREEMNPGAVLWVSWPKRAAKLPGDVTEDVVREIALPLGLVDVKVAAVDEVWSGLKLVVRKSLR